MFSSQNSQVSSAANYIEDVFSTYLYTGNGSTQTITNGIDLSGEGGLVWIKNRTSATPHCLFDTERGATYSLASNTTDEQVVQSAQLTAFNNNGFSLGVASNVNGSSTNYASWTFRKQAKFFDVVTYTGTGSNTTISHSLGSVPACIMVKRTDTTGDWQVYHSSLANTEYLVLNTTAAKATGATRWNSTTPTSTVFSIGTDATVNASGGTYVAYLFAHDAGGFGDSGSDNVITCGSYTTDGSGNADITLGYEPQWFLTKITNTTGNWSIRDNMRGWNANSGSSTSSTLLANSSAAESSGGGGYGVTSTGIQVRGINTNATFIYIAIRRGPMKTPTSGTSVFTSVTKTGVTSVGQTNTTNFPVDLSIDEGRATNYGATFFDRLRGSGPYLNSSSTAAEANQNPTYYIGFDSNTSVFNKNYGALGATYVNWLFQRAPSFFDEVCYTGTSATTAFNHNLSVAPELIIVKRRNDVATWPVGTLFTASTCKELTLDTTNSATNSTYSDYFGGQPTSTTFTMASSTGGNLSGSTYVAYLFATCTGVSKVGSYTGTGTTLQVDCGFTGGARFVLIKRTDSTGDWYVWDSARGIVSGNDPYLLLNSTAAEVTNTDYVDTYSAGFEISSTAPAAINASGGTFIFLAIA